MPVAARRLRQTLRRVWSGRDVRARNAESPSFHGLFGWDLPMFIMLALEERPEEFGGFYGEDRGVVVQ